MPTHRVSNYSKKYIEKLYVSGLTEQFAFVKKAQSKEMINNEALRDAIISNVKKNKFDRTLFNMEIELLNIFKLFCFIQAWADLEENWINDADNEYKKNVNN